MSFFSKYLVLGLILILLSTPLAHISANFYNVISGNIVGVYEILLIGFISSYLMIGFLISLIGIIKIVNITKNK